MIPKVPIFCNIITTGEPVRTTQNKELVFLSEQANYQLLTQLLTQK